MICLDCAMYSNKNDYKVTKCVECDDCVHVCKGKCQILTRKKKMKSIEDHKKGVIDIPEHMKAKETSKEAVCEYCLSIYTPKHHLQKFCNTRCKNHNESKKSKERGVSKAD